MKKLYTLALVLLCMAWTLPAHAAVVDSAPVEPGLLAWWSFDGKGINWTSNRITDQSTRGNTGTLVNLSTTTSPTKGKIGQAMLFDGNITSISLTANPSAPTASRSSGCATVYTKSVALAPTGWNQTIFNFYTDANNGIRMGSVVTTGALFVSYRVGGTYSGAQTSATVFANNVWTHVCYVWSGSGITLYANGVSLATTTNTDSMGTVNTVGARDDQGDGNWFGALDDIRIYNRALSGNEIKRLSDEAVGSKQAVTPVGPANLNRGLVGWWTFDGKDMRNGVALDKSGQGNSGNPINIATSTFYSAGKIGQGILLDGSDDYVNTLGFTSTNLSAYPLTLSVWAKTKVITGNQQLIAQSANTGGFQLYLDVTNKRLAFSNGASSPGTTNSVTSPNAWNHYVVTITSGSVASFYVNGVAAGTASGLTALDWRSGNLRFGKVAANTSEIYNGSLDDVRIYNRALSAAEVRLLYQDGSSRQDVSLVGPANLNSGLVGWWTFDGKNMANGVAQDISGQGNSGNLINIATSTFYAQGKIGQAGKFDGVDDSLQTSSDFIGSSAATVTAWINPIGYGGVTGSIFGRIIDNGKIQFYTDNTNCIKCLTFSSDGATTNIRTPDNTVSLNQWKFVTITRTANGTANFYINGVLSGSANQSSGTPASGTTNVIIGNRSTGSRTFNGSLDDVRIYNRALSAAEVRLLYNLGR